ncbi:hypothetical protein [Burkholderia sp. Ac-20365]|uniref:hypothetical protein n=1 Tax=Burkholderia sp. Ac-20365 TaxID=2703897 RepID=UPI00197C053D|nr:hypothetical protein [Burkholderia sp. Ac-20365]MBN3761166.1 hypothetical protein [Burkholderia sp. Ac-20365]
MNTQTFFSPGTASTHGADEYKTLSLTQGELALLKVGGADDNPDGASHISRDDAAASKK